MILYPIQKKWRYLAPLVKKIPDKLLILPATGFVKIQKRGLKKSEIPERLVLFVTKKCNLHCKHCFYILHTTTKTPEMSLGEFKKIACSAKNLLKQVVFTGGEPFVRNDFKNIVFSFIENGCRTVNIITNGTFTDKLGPFLDEIIVETKAELVFMISFDGPPALHDEIRGVNNASKKTLASLSLISQYRNKYPKRFGDIFITTSLNRLNVSYLPEIIDQIKPFKNIRHSFNFTRSADLNTFGVNSQDLSGFNVENEIILSIDEMKKAFRYLDKELWNKKDVSILSLINRQLMIETIRVLEKKSASFTCLSGQTELIIYPEGEVGICEMLKPIGNLKETEFDLKKFYDKNKSQFRDEKKCRCTHDCTILSSIRFSPESLVELAKHKEYNS